MGSLGPNQPVLITVEGITGSCSVCGLPLDGMAWLSFKGDARCPLGDAYVRMMTDDTHQDKLQA